MSFIYAVQTYTIHFMYITVFHKRSPVITNFPAGKTTKSSLQLALQLNSVVLNHSALGLIVQLLHAAA